MARVWLGLGESQVHKGGGFSLRVLRTRLALLLGFAMAPALGLAIEENPQSFIYQGRFFNSAGSQPISDGNYDIHFRIYDESGNCLLYHEQQATVATTSGYFSVEIGTAMASPRRQGDDPGLTMEQIFSNKTKSVACGAGSTWTTYIPTSGQRRMLKVENVTLGTNLADQIITGVPTALVAETLQGLQPRQFLNLNGTFASLSGTTLQTGTVSAFSDSGVLAWDGANWIAHTLILPSNILQGGATSNQVLKWSGAAWAPAADADSFATATPGGDISGSFSTMNVAKLQNQTLTLGASPATGDLLTWNGTAWVNLPPALSGSVNGDLAGTLPNPTVDGLQGLPVSSTSPSAGQYLSWSGSQWIGATVTSVSPGGSAGGDLSGTYPNPDVVKLRGIPLNSTVPSSTAQVLRINSSTEWAPMTINDLVASSGNTMFVRLSGDTMVGNLVMSSSKVLGLGFPSADDEATSRGYVNNHLAGSTISGLGTLSAGQILRWDGGAWVPYSIPTSMSTADADARYVNVAGDTVTGNFNFNGVYALSGGYHWQAGSTIDAGNNKIINVATPTGTGDAVPWEYLTAVASNAYAYYVKKSGDTVNGVLYAGSTIVMGNNALTGLRWPSSNTTDAATKGYVDYVVSTLGSGNNGNYVSKSGDTMTGYLYMMGGSLGIGNMAPSAALEVTGDIHFSMGGARLIGVENDGGVLTIKGSDSSTGSDGSGNNLVIRAGNADPISSGFNGGDLYLYGGTKTGAGSEGDVVLGHTGAAVVGRVGVGTASPSARLHVDSSAASATQGLILSNLGSGNGANVGVYQSFNVGGNEMGRIFGANRTATVLSNSYLSFYTRGLDILSERMRIDYNGYVGIGTMVPNEALEVNGNIYVSGAGGYIRFPHTYGDANDGKIGNSMFAQGLNIVGINNDNTARKIQIWGGITQNQNDLGNSIAGSTSFSGVINLNNNYVHGVRWPSATTDAATKGYVDLVVSTISSSAPKFYLTPATYNGSTADTACAAGYHICAPGEWLGRRYDNSLGGIMGNGFGWVDDNGSNCVGWTSTGSTGTTFLYSNATGTDFGFTNGGALSCGTGRPVWCCTD